MKRDTYTVPELRIVHGKFFPKWNKNTVYYLMSNGEYGFFTKNVIEIEIIGQISIIKEKGYTRIYSKENKEMFVTIQNKKLIMEA